MNISLYMGLSHIYLFVALVTDCPFLYQGHALYSLHSLTYYGLFPVQFQIAMKQQIRKNKIIIKTIFPNGA